MDLFSECVLLYFQMYRRFLFVLARDPPVNMYFHWFFLKGTNFFFLSVYVELFTHLLCSCARGSSSRKADRSWFVPSRSVLVALSHWYIACTPVENFVSETRSDREYVGRCTCDHVCKYVWRMRCVRAVVSASAGAACDIGGTLAGRQCLGSIGLGSSFPEKSEPIYMLIGKDFVRPCFQLLWHCDIIIRHRSINLVESRLNLQRVRSQRLLKNYYCFVGKLRRLFADIYI